MDPEKKTLKSRALAVLTKIKSDKRLTVAVIAVAVLLLLGIAYILFNSSDSPPAQNTNSTGDKTAETSGPPIWEYNQEKLEWFVKSGAAPACKDPFAFDMTPVDMTKVTAVGLPGAYRGFSYKAHGGFRLKDNTEGFADVKMPMDAKLMSVSRYYERVPGADYELQYILDFENDCGIAFRFDHIHTLTPAFQAYADQSPEPKKDDTRSDGSTQPIRKPFKAGEIIATRTGFPIAKNYGFDFGVYDYRQPNEISKNKEWVAIHKMFSAQHFHGVCWIPMLPAADAASAEAMAKDRNNYNSSKPFNLTSDYCDFAPHKTLEFNNGQPTDG